ncbi:MAG: tRNA 4-thiouridine(8) synthase ThiI [Mycoplasmataceae bacterium]|nr:tRNA 4-thiouridine(8) synthase ThiI [Mycoplasmataceae bacterium]
MNKLFLVKYSELTLKGKNRRQFTVVLLDNLKRKFKKNKINAIIKGEFDRILITPDSSSEFPLIEDLLQELIGISWYAIINEVEGNLDSLKQIIKQIIDENNYKTFRVTGKSYNKNLFSSSDNFTRTIADYILSISKLKVNLTNYDVDFNVLATAKKTYQIFTTKVKTKPGLPPGVNGKGLTLLSGGIDSPVAAYQLIQRGVNSSFVSFLTTSSLGGKTEEKINLLAQRINKFNGTDQKLFIVDFQKVQREIASLEEEEYRTILLRRYFLRFAELLSKKHEYKIFITGDVIGQVASQTTASISVIGQATSKFVAHPLIGTNKEDIITKAKFIKTLDISNMEGNDMCAVFSPKKPHLYPKLDDVLELEKELMFMDDVLKDILKNETKIIRLGEKDDN